MQHGCPSSTAVAERKQDMGSIYHGGFFQKGRIRVPSWRADLSCWSELLPLSAFVENAVWSPKNCTSLQPGGSGCPALPWTRFACCYRSHTEKVPFVFRSHSLHTRHTRMHSPTPFLGPSVPHLTNLPSWSPQLVPRPSYHREGESDQIT